MTQQLILQLKSFEESMGNKYQLLLQEFTALREQYHTDKITTTIFQQKCAALLRTALYEHELSCAKHLRDTTGKAVAVISAPVANDELDFTDSNGVYDHTADEFRYPVDVEPYADLTDD
jgi:hypothetical protein